MTIPELSKRLNLSQEAQDDVKNWALNFISRNLCGFSLDEQKIRLTSGEYERYMRDLNDAYNEYERIPVDPNQTELFTDAENQSK